MKFFRLDLLTLLISLFILNSCRHQDNIGLGINPNTQSGNLIDTATIVVNTLPDAASSDYEKANGLHQDSIVTSGIAKSPLGYFIDPAFGTTESNIAVQLNLPGNSSFTLPSGTITVDSAVLVLHYADGFYGDSLASKYKINVYQLSTKLKGTQNYYNNTPLNTYYDPQALVGSRTFNSRTHDSVRIYNIITGKPDTLIKVAPQLRVPINKDFINRILFNASAQQLSSNTVFQNSVKGLYLTLDKTGTTGAGGTFMLSLADSINVYYRSVTGTTIDTVMTSLPLGLHAAQIKHTPSNAVVTELNNTGTSRNILYLQGLAGLKTKISFPYLKSILATVKSNIVINRAELVITPVPGSTIPYKAQPKLTMYRYDIAHQPEQLQDATATDPRSGGSGVITTFGGFYSPISKNYHFLVTGFIQDLISGKTVDYGTFISPVDTASNNDANGNPIVIVGPSTQTTGRVIAVGSDKNSPYRIRLNIIYTKITN